MAFAVERIGGVFKEMMNKEILQKTSIEEATRFFHDNTSVVVQSQVLEALINDIPVRITISFKPGVVENPIKAIKMESDDEKFIMLKDWRY